MKPLSRFLSLLLAVILPLPCLSANAALRKPHRVRKARGVRIVRRQIPSRPEMRAFWADGFNDGYKTPEQIDTLLQRLHDAHCNAIFAQVRKGGDAYYLSRYEPWATDDPQHFDALAHLIQRAHAMNPPIQVHAWINTCAVGKGKGHPTNHVAQIHPEYLSVNPENDPDDHEAYKIDPGHPDAADWTFRLYLDVARHYAVDGVHFDFVRYGAKNWGYNPVSVARFQAAMSAQGKTYKAMAGSRQPDPADPNWKQWRRDQVTNLVRKVYAHAAQVNPRVVVSAATICWADGPRTMQDWTQKSAAMNRVYQDWRGWLEEGMLDLACPMTYFSAIHNDYEATWSTWIKEHQYRRAATVAVGTWLNTIGQSLDQMSLARSPSAKGNLPYGVLLYSYQGTNKSEKRDADGKQPDESFSPAFYAALSSPSPYSTIPPFPSAVPVPPMPWKTAPRYGHLKGFVLTPALDAVDGAPVTVTGQGKTWKRQTDGTGFYALVDLPPGNYTVRLSAPGFTPQTTKTTIMAGHVATVGFTAGHASIPLTTAFADLLDKAAPNLGTPVRAQNLLVLLGTDTFADGKTLYVRDSIGTALRVSLASMPVLALQPGDVVSLTGTLDRVEGEPALAHALCRLTDIRPDSALSAPIPLKTLVPGAALPGRGATVTTVGTVTSVSGGNYNLRLDDGSGTIEVALAGRKDPGIEATAFSMTPPALGTRLSVSGILVPAQPDPKAASILRLRPRLASDAQTLPTLSFWNRTKAHEVALTFFRRPARISASSAALAHP